MKTEFLRPRFDGPRFDEHTLPVEVARDLAAYEELVIELAKHLYREEHQDRQRLPKGFEKNFHHMELLPNQVLATRIEELAALQNGWLEGQGKALVEIRENSEIQNPKYCLPSVPRCRWQMPSRASWVFPRLPKVPRRWLRASDFGFLSAFGIRLCPIACFTETPHL